LIYDIREHLEQYKGLSANMDCAIDYILKTDFSKMAAGKYPVDGDRVFALVQSPTTYPKEQAKWEAHNAYIDIQYLLDGEEIIGSQKTGFLKIAEPFREGNDIAFYYDNREGFFPVLKPGTFVVCFPTDAHMPLICPNKPQKIKKVVMKVKAD